MKMVQAIRLMALAALSVGCVVAQQPAPYGPTPTAQQVDWLRMEWYAFVHFSLNTFTNKEWGYGDESPELFNPGQFNARDIVGTFKEAGMTGMIYTAKHHDGWCAWPTKSTSHSIRKSPWKKGKGDVVKEFADACAHAGIKFGTYLSPWDRNCAEYGRDGYRKVYYRQIQELLKNYGPIFEIWFDGANGGDGFYGGARERRNIGSADKYYDYKQVVRNIRRLQPDCIIWGAAQRGDVVWGGSEKGFVKYPLWNARGDKWISLEGDTPINHVGWFWHPGQAGRVKTPEHLMNVYLSSVGRGANLILNVAPNRDGVLDAADVESLLSFGAVRRQMLSRDYALGAATHSESDSFSKKTGTGKLTDGDIESFWSPEAGTAQPSVEFKLRKKETFDVVRLREQIRLGQRVESFKVEAKVDGDWVTIVEPGTPGEEETGLETRGGKGHTIGNQVLRWLKEPVTTNHLRLTITASRAVPCISEFSLLRMPKMMPKPEMTRKGNMLHIETDGDYKIFYTTDGRTPTEESAEYRKPVEFDSPGTVKAVYVNREDGSIGPVATLNLGYAKDEWKSDDAGKAFDDDASSHWKGDSAPATFEVDMGKEQEVAAFSYLPRQDKTTEAMTDQYKLELSRNGRDWDTVAEGEFSNLRANPIELKVNFEPATARYFRFTGKRALDGKGVTVAEINMFPEEKEDKPHSRKKKSRKKKSKKK